MTNPHHRFLPQSLSFGKEEKAASDFSQFDGRRFAVVLDGPDQRTVLRGTGYYLKDDLMGNALRICLVDEPGDPEIIVSEENWKGKVIPDFQYGCEFCIVIRRG